MHAEVGAASGDRAASAKSSGRARARSATSRWRRRTTRSRARREAERARRAAERRQALEHRPAAADEQLDGEVERRSRPAPSAAAASQRLARGRVERPPRRARSATQIAPYSPARRERLRAPARAAGAWPRRPHQRAAGGSGLRHRRRRIGVRPVALKCGPCRTLRDLRARLPPRRAARCSSRTTRRRPTSSTARCRCSAWSSSASCSGRSTSTGRPRRTSPRCSAAWRSCCWRSRSPTAPAAGPSGGPADRRHARARRLRPRAGAAAADLRRPVAQRARHRRRQPAAARADLAVVGFGLLSIVRWVLGRAAQPAARARWTLLSRALPLLLDLRILLFPTTEIWQIFADDTDASTGDLVGLFVVLGTAFLVVRLPREATRLEREAVERGRRRSPPPAGQRRPGAVRQPGAPGPVRQPRDRRLLRRLRHARRRRPDPPTRGSAPPATSWSTSTLGEQPAS